MNERLEHSEQNRVSPGALSRGITYLVLLAAAGLFAKEHLAGDGAFSRWSAFWTGTPAGLGLLVVLALNLLAGSLSRVLSALLKPTVTEGRVEQMDGAAIIPTVESGVLAGWLRKHRFSGGEGPGGVIVGRRGRFSFLPGLAVRVGLLVLGTGLVLSARGREVESARLRVGEAAEILGSSVALESIEEVLPERALQFGSESRFRLGNLSGTVRTDGGKVRVAHHPPAAAGGLRYRLVAIGFAPEFVVGKGGGEERVAMPLRLMPPGSRDTIMTDLAGPLDVQLEPEETIRKGTLEGRWYNLRDPAYRVFPGGSSSGVSVVPGPGVSTGDLRISVDDDVPPWVEVEAVRDPGLGLVHVGLWTLGAGLLLLLLRPFWYLRTVAFVPVPGEGYLFGYEEEFFKRWAGYRFQRWIEEFLPVREARSVIADLDPGPEER